MGYNRWGTGLNIKRQPVGASICAVNSGAYFFCDENETPIIYRCNRYG